MIYQLGYTNVDRYCYVVDKHGQLLCVSTKCYDDEFFDNLVKVKFNAFKQANASLCGFC